MIQLTEKREARAQELHERCFVVNALTLDHTATQGRWFGEMRTGGTNCFWATLGGDNFRDTMFTAAEALCFVDAHRDQAVQVTTVAEMGRAKEQGKVGIVFLTQNSACLEGDYALLSVMYRLGYRVMGIAYSEGNLLGDGCAERTREVRGLSYFGIEVVKEMNQLGILIDVSHSGDATIEDVLKTSKAPVVCTHSNVRAISNTTRNRTDEQIKGIAASGGMVGITPLPRMVHDDPRKATLDGALDHIDYVVKLAGIDHVGLGTDFTDCDLPGRVRGDQTAGAAPHVLRGRRAVAEAAA